MLGWGGLGLFAVAGGLLLRWWLRRTDALGRPVGGPWISVGLLVVLGTCAVVPGVLRQREERRLSAAASTLVGVHVHVHCQGLGGAFVDATAELGYVRFGADGRPEHATTIKRDQCRDLSHYLGAHGHDPTPDEVVAVHVLTHESMHMAGITDEAQAECAAMQRDEPMAGLLGARPADAGALAVRYWRTVYPDMPDGYRSAGCVPGGGMDEHRGQGPWPG